jgi:hypothetical protein
VNLGDYTPLSETEDLRGLLGMLMRRVESLEWERGQEREGKRQKGTWVPWVAFGSCLLAVEVKVEEDEEEEW